MGVVEVALKKVEQEGTLLLEKEDNHSGGITWKISKGDKIVRDAITDQFCIFLTLIKKTVTTEVDKIRRRSVQTDKYTLKSRQFHSYNN